MTQARKPDEHRFHKRRLTSASTIETAATAVQLYFKTEYFTPEVFYSE
jgi:hypothetical protein